MSFYSKVIDELFAAFSDYNVVMLPQVFCGYEYSSSDVDFFRDLAKLKNDNRIIVTPDCYSSDIQQTIIRDAKALLGSRYHSIVFAINQNVPFVALSYEHKIVGLLETLGKENFCIDITKTFDKAENEKATIDQIRRLLPVIDNYEVAQNKAKEIASRCMDKFVSTFKMKEI